MRRLLPLCPRALPPALLLAVPALAQETPYGVPYRPDIWGAGWGVRLLDRYISDNHEKAEK